MRINQNSFVGGELDPDLMGRQDLQAYFKSAARLENFLVLRAGAATKRPGTDFVATVPNGATSPYRLIPFPYDSTRGDLLLMSALALHVLGSDGTWGAAVTAPWTSAQVPDVSVKQSGDTLFFCHPDVVPHTLVRTPPSPDTGKPEDWTWTLAPYVFFPDVPVPVGVTATATGFSGTNNKNYLYRVAALTAAGESFASEPVTATVPQVWTAGAYITVSWTAVAGAVGYRVYKKLRGSYGLISNTGNDAVKVSTSGATASVSALSSGLAANLIDGNTATYAVTGKDGNGHLFAKIDFGSGVTKTVCGVRVYEYFYYGVGDFDLQYSSDNTNWTTLNSFRHTPSGDTWSLFASSEVYASARYWRILATDAAATWGIGEIEWMGVGLATSVVDDNIEPDIAESPIAQSTPFPGSDGYPADFALYQQRAMFAGVPGTPHRIWFSRLADLFNFGTSEVSSDEDGIVVTMAVTEPSAIRHLLPSRRNVMVFTEASEWICGPGNNADSIKPSAIQFDFQGNIGCGRLPPMSIGDRVIFTSRNDASVRETGYDLSRDAYVSQDRSVLSGHLFEGRTIAAWTFQQLPDGIVWCVMSDGALLSWTYLPEHEVWAWARHSTAGGLFLDVACTRHLVGSGENTDETYVLVDRGTLGVCLERLRVRIDSDTPDTEDALCLDCVRAVGAGAPTGFVTVGTTCGLRISATLTTLRPEPADGSVHGLRKRVTEVLLRLRRAGCDGLTKIGPNSDMLVPVKEMASATADGTTALKTGDVKVSVRGAVNMDGNLTLVSTDVFPLTVLAMIYNIDMEGQE